MLLEFTEATNMKVKKGNRTEMKAERGIKEILYWGGEIYVIHFAYLL